MDGLFQLEDLMVIKSKFDEIGAGIGLDIDQFCEEFANILGLDDVSKDGLSRLFMSIDADCDGVVDWCAPARPSTPLPLKCERPRWGSTGWAGPAGRAAASAKAVRVVPLQGVVGDRRHCYGVGRPGPCDARRPLARALGLGSGAVARRCWEGSRYCCCLRNKLILPHGTHSLPASSPSVTQPHTDPPPDPCAPGPSRPVPRSPHRQLWARTPPRQGS